MSKINKAEEVFATFVAAIPNLGMNVYMGMDSDKQIRPCVVCWCRGGPEEPQPSGNHRFRMTLMVKSQADKASDDDVPEATHAANVERVYDAVNIEELAAALNALGIAEFWAYEPILDLGVTPDIQGRAFVESRDYEVFCAGERMTA